MTIFEKLVLRALWILIRVEWSPRDKAASEAHFKALDVDRFAWETETREILVTGKLTIPGLTVIVKPLETYLIVREADGDRELNPAEVGRIAALFGAPTDGLCDDCPPPDYPTDKMRCVPCPRRKPTVPS